MATTDPAKIIVLKKIGVSPTDPHHNDAYYKMKMEEMATKSAATQKACKLTKEDYELFGVTPSPHV